MPSPRKDSRVRSRLRPASDLALDPGDGSRSDLAMAAVRESDEYDLGPMDDMIVKVLEPLLPLFPDLQPLIDIGARLFKAGPEGDRLRRNFKVEALYGEGARRRPTAYAVDRAGIRVILGLVSAGKATVDGGGDNAWSMVLAHQVRSYKPATFHTGSLRPHPAQQGPVRQPEDSVQEPRHTNPLLRVATGIRDVRCPRRHGLGATGPSSALGLDRQPDPPADGVAPPSQTGALPTSDAAARVRAGIGPRRALARHFR